ncbi:MAG: outer membrane protein [Alphaproteobacteria bacterium]
MKNLLTFLTVVFISSYATAAEPQNTGLRPYLSMKVGTTNVSLKDSYGYTLDKDGVQTTGGAIGLTAADQIRFEIEFLHYDEISNDFYKRNVSSLLANIFYDITQSTVRPYIGFGAGTAYIEEENRRWISEETTLAAAVHFGVSVHFNDNAAIDLSGRASYFGETDFFKIDQSSFSALAALRFSF